MLVLESTEWVEMSDTIFNTILLTMKISKNVLSHAHTRMQHFEKMIVNCCDIKSNELVAIFQRIAFKYKKVGKILNYCR